RGGRVGIQGYLETARGRHPKGDGPHAAAENEHALTRSARTTPEPSGKVPDEGRRCDDAPDERRGQKPRRTAKRTRTPWPPAFGHDDVTPRLDALVGDLGAKPRGKKAFVRIFAKKERAFGRFRQEGLEGARQGRPWPNADRMLGAVLFAQVDDGRAVLLRDEK